MRSQSDTLEIHFMIYLTNSTFQYITVRDKVLTLQYGMLAIPCPALTVLHNFSDISGKNHKNHCTLQKKLCTKTLHFLLFVCCLLLNNGVPEQNHPYGPLYIIQIYSTVHETWILEYGTSSLLYKTWTEKCTPTSKQSEKVTVNLASFPVVCSSLQC